MDAPKQSHNGITHTSSPATPATGNDHPPNSPDLGNIFPTLDSQINHQASRDYWSSIPATIDGMLGGHPQVSLVDLRGSKSFIRKIQRLSRVNSAAKSPSSADSHSTMIPRILDCGAGIGRITSGLLVHIATQVDIVEPIAKFAQVMIDSDLKRSGQVGEVWVQGLESFTPPLGRKYDIIVNQWFLGHLTDQQVVEWLERAKRCLRGYDGATGEEEENGNEDGEGVSGQRGWIFVKENLSTDMFERDIYDDLDSSMTRTDATFRRIFEEAGLRIVKMELQSGFPKGLCPVKMYALRPK